MQHARTLIDEAATCGLLGGSETPIHRSTLWRGIKAGRFPKPIKIGPGTNRWDAHEVTALVERAASEREAA